MTATFNDDEDGFCERNETEAAEIETLSKSRTAKFEQIKALIAEQHDANQALPENAGLVAAKDACQRCQADAALKGSARELITPLQKLLQEHWELEERILDIEDGAVERYFLPEDAKPDRAAPGLVPTCQDQRHKPIPGEWYLGVPCSLCDEKVLYAPDISQGHGKLAFFEAHKKVQDCCVRGHLTSFWLDEMQRFRWRPQ